MNDKHKQEFEFSQVTNNIFLGTNICCLDKTHTQALTDLGITAEIDLEKEGQNPVAEIEIYLRLPTVDKTAPSVPQIKAGVALIDRMVNIDKKVYVHCKFGHGRSPTLVAAFLISKGKTVSEAIETIKKNRPEVHLNEIQMKALKEFSDREE
ncbi:dual specificity protein phosphatase family protein [Candidatus Microgenomates bacterium]|nr:dual specificity protein phosphatase family protein [Candidatus Microgenomates bacterium]